jgi:hypothetical protein
MTRFRSFCALILLAVVTAMSAAAAEPVFPPGSRIGLEPPPGMVPSKRFTGFADAEREAGILVVELPGAAYPQMESTLFTKPQANVADLSRRKFTFNGGTAVLAAGTARDNDKKLRKWFFLATNGGATPDLTAFITVEVPEAARGVYTDAVIESALKTVTFRKTPVVEQLAMMPFALNDLAGFRVRQVVPSAGTVVLTEKEDGGLFDQPYVVVSVAPGGPANPADRARFAQDLINNAPVRDLTMTSGETMRIKGQPGNEIRATAKDADDKPISMVQWLRFGSGGFMRIVAVGPTPAWDALFPRFRAVRDGVETK